MEIWEFTYYRKYLQYMLGPEGSRTGMRKKLAAALPVHTTFVSQVLKAKAEFSLEQAESINVFFDHTHDEGEYFILLLLKDRAGSQKLKKRFEDKIEEVREAHLNIKKRLKATDEISVSDRDRFYSSALYGATHVLSSLPGYQTVESLAEGLRIPRSQMREIVDFLLKIGLLVENGSLLARGPLHIHLDNSSEMILRHHINWRLNAMANLQILNRDDLHYSACVSLSVADAFRVKEVILEGLKKNVDLISKSPEEVAYVLNIDFYKLAEIPEPRNSIAAKK